jgi:hypothetical protein
MRHAAAVGLVLATAVACGLPMAAEVNPAPPPSETAAVAYLREVVEIVAAGDLERLCALGGGACRRELEFGMPAVPRTPPRLVGSVEVPTTWNPDGTWNAGGRLLMLCGVDGLGSPYYSEVLVFEEARRLIGREPVFWTGVTIETLPATVRPGPPRGCPPP